MRLEIVNETDFAIEKSNLLENIPRNHCRCYNKLFGLRKQSVSEYDCEGLDAKPSSVLSATFAIMVL